MPVETVAEASRTMSADEAEPACTEVAVFSASASKPAGTLLIASQPAPNTPNSKASRASLTLVARIVRLDTHPVRGGGFRSR